ncbi:MAG: carbamoyl-phosphate synthase large subunit, partial [Hydrogenovibrio sp.]|nr:carbamoyl-phosphate synthase large subunit [Hydrogenovibrio sp.]
DAIDKAENRERFRQAMNKIGLDMPVSAVAHNMEEAWAVQERVGYPTVIRPSFTLGGSGGGIAYNKQEFEDICKFGLELSPTNELLIEESILGWKEYEMEVVRDKNDNAIIVCSIENLDPMGVHTGDSITVAPAQTLTDKEYQIMRNASLAVLREIGVETGGSNVQFAIEPKTGRMIIIEMNPRVSRSSALASKATGFPIAKIAAKLAVGYTLDELRNDITDGATPASFEPTIDYVVTKVPRFTFEKFPQAQARLSTQMKSVGEVMAMGRSFQESVQKALRGLETGKDGFDEVMPLAQMEEKEIKDILRQELRSPGPERLWYVADAFRAGWDLETVYDISKIDPWFLSQIQELILMEDDLKQRGLDALDENSLRNLKRKGFSDNRLAKLLNTDAAFIRKFRHTLNVRPVFKRVDTCAAEFETSTAYMYSTYESECEAQPTDRDKIMVLGGGPNRIGQGIEFDYCCVHAAMAMREDGYETIMVNCNPETVSTDYDTSDRLYFEPLTLEDVLEIVEVEKPKGVIVQYGGQTPLKLAEDLEEAGVPIIGTSPESIDLAEDRERFQQLLHNLNLQQPPNRTARSEDQALALANEIGYPLVVRPSYVLGGRAMEIVYSDADLSRYMTEAVKVSNDSPVLLDRFLDDAVELDVDAVCDGEQVVIGGVMEHIEQAGIHSGDSACSLPPYSIPMHIQDEIRTQVAKMAKALNVVGLMNTQFAVKGEEIYVLEVNPRASRTVPFVSKSIGQPLAKIAARCMVGQKLEAQGFTQEIRPDYFSVKEAVFPFIKFLGVDPILGPEMKSTGEVMGIGDTFAEAYQKAQLAGGTVLPTSGQAFLSVRQADRVKVLELARKLIDKGFSILATRGTAKALEEAGIECEVVNKVTEGRPNIVDSIVNEEVDLIVNTSDGSVSIKDSSSIRREALMHKICYTTTMAGALAMVASMEYLDNLKVTRLQDLN